MDNITFKLIDKGDILIVLPLLQELNTTTSESLLKERLLEMSEQNYECVGVYMDDELIGMSGMWFMTRHYCGKSIEPDHVVITTKHQGKGIGKQLFKFRDYPRLR